MAQIKRNTARRTIPILPMVVNALKEWKLACPKGELGLVFPNGTGNVDWHANIIRDGLWPTQVAAGVTVPAIDVAGRKDGEPVW